MKEETKRKEDYSIMKTITLLLVITIGISTVFTMIDYPKQYDCYQTQCTEYNLDKYSSCEDLGSERVGFLTSEHFYFCDGRKLTKECTKWEEVKQDINPSLIDVLEHKCTTLEDKE